MRPGGRIAAAIDVLDQVLRRHRPVAEALSDWGKSHRFAGSGDRAAIGNLVYDALRRRLSLAAQMDSDTSRALALAAAPRALGLSLDAIATAVDGSEHVPEPITAEERGALSRELSPGTPPHVAGDVPDWLMPSFERAFGARAAAEGAALAQRAPVDLRVNTLKATPEKVLKALVRHAPAPTRYAPDGVRIAAPQGPQRAPHIEAEAGHGKGWFEIQDEGSQVAAALAGAGPRLQVLDICAGSGGKTLALAARMQNTGQIFAYDGDRLRLRPIHERLKRAGIRNAQVLSAGDEAELGALGPRFDVVLVDAPCTGSGVWRRRPDAKWRLRPQQLAERRREQQAVLALAAPLVKPGGRLVYVTCSVLPEENGDQVAELLGRMPEFAAVPWRQGWGEALATAPPSGSADGSDGALLLTPGMHETDGFFVALLEHRGV